jgi:hypothetical protein
MMKIGPCRRIHTLVLVIFSLCLALLLARGQDATLTLMVATESVAAGGDVSIWLNALNASSNDITWTFLANIERKIISPQGTFDGSLELRSAETNVVMIAPGAFVRREYVFTVPDQITGQIVMEFPGLNVNRAVLDVQAPPAVMMAPEKKTNSLFIRFVKEVEPEEPGKGLEPDRFFKEHISGYEPMYFIAGPKTPNAKFQISFAYQLLNNDGPLADKIPNSRAARFSHRLHADIVVGLERAVRAVLRHELQAGIFLFLGQRDARVVHQLVSD